MQQPIRFPYTCTLITYAHILSQVKRKQCISLINTLTKFHQNRTVVLAFQIELLAIMTQTGQESPSGAQE